MSVDAITTSACLSIERACSRSKVSASSWLWVTRLGGTRMLPLVSVPDVTMNFFIQFVCWTLANDRSSLQLDMLLVLPLS